MYCLNTFRYVNLYKKSTGKNVIQTTVLTHIGLDPLSRYFSCWVYRALCRLNKAFLIIFGANSAGFQKTWSLLFFCSKLVWVLLVKRKCFDIENKIFWVCFWSTLFTVFCHVGLLMLVGTGLLWGVWLWLLVMIFFGWFFDSSGFQ